MVVLVIIGILASVAVPSMSGANRESEGRAFAAGLARDLQRARMDAISTRFAQRAFVFSDRVLFRSAQFRDAADPTSPIDPPDVNRPILRTVQAKDRIRVVSVSDTFVPGGGTDATPAAAIELQFDGRGQLTFITPAMAPPRNAWIWIENGGVAVGHPYHRFRLEINGMTGMVRLVESW
jgi:type II secretory pathway pseudopilin PulG